MRNLLFFIVVFWTACKTGYIDKTPNGYFITRNGKFALREKSAAIHSFSVIQVYKLDGAGSWLTFFPNGKVCSSLEIVYANIPKRDTVSFAGYYVLNGSNIKMEMTAGQKGNDWSVLVVQGAILGDSINFTSDKWYGSGRNVHQYTKLRDVNGIPKYYIRMNNPVLRKPPDW